MLAINKIAINKIVVFDLDETLGYFVELGLFWEAISAFVKQYHLGIKMDQFLFNKVLDLFPEFLRPEIVTILKYIKNKRIIGECSKIFIYTNNQGPKKWGKFIINYFEDKIDYKLFDKIVAAFKIDETHVEICRTSHMKNHKDLVRCTQIPDNTQICFLDDVYYPRMHNSNIYYINIKPYVHKLSFTVMIERFIKSKIIPLDKEGGKICQQYLLGYMNEFKSIFVPVRTKILTADNIFDHLKTFFSNF
jgi:hypothetical protein